MSDDRQGPLWALLGCQAALTAGLALSFPFFAIYLNRDRGLPMGWVGFWLSMMLVGTALGSAVAGELSDVRGAKFVMVSALVWRGALVAAMAAAVWRNSTVALIIALHIVGGVFGQFFDPAMRSWIAGRFSAARRVAYFGYHRMAVNLGWAVGPALGGFLAGRSYALAFAVTALFCGGCALVLARSLHGEGSPRGVSTQSWRDLFSARPDKRFVEHCAYSLLIAAVMAQLTTSLSVHSITYAALSETQVGFLFALNGILVLLLMWPASSWSGGRLTGVIAGGCALYAVGYLGVGFARGFLPMTGAVAVVTLGEILVTPRIPSLTANLAPPTLVGRYMGLQGLAFTLGSALGPLIGGTGLQYLSPRWPAAPWVVVGGLGTAAAGGFLRLGRSLTLDEEGLIA